MADTSQQPEQPRLPKRFDSILTEISEGDYWTDAQADGVRLNAGSTEYAGIERARLTQVDMSGADLTGLQAMDVLFAQCDLSNGVWYEPSLHRIAFVGGRLTGLSILQGTLKNVLLQDCNLQWAQFRFNKFTRVRFERCILAHADFHGSDLSGVTFAECDLQEAQFHQAQLQGTDFRGSKITGLGAGVAELQGAIFEPPQAMELCHLLGIVVKWRDG